VQMKAARAKLRQLPKVLNGEIRDAAVAIVAKEVPRIQSAGRSSSRQAAAAVAAVRPKRDRIPAIAAGGAKKMPTSTGAVRAEHLFFGAEFGGQRRPTTQQFRPHKGTQGYWFWPTLRQDAPDMLNEWGGALDGLVDDWERGI